MAPSLGGGRLPPFPLRAPFLSFSWMFAEVSVPSVALLLAARPRFRGGGGCLLLLVRCCRCCKWPLMLLGAHVLAGGLAVG